MQIKSRSSVIAIILTVAGIATGYGIAQTANHETMSHQYAGNLPTEVGQSAFVAIAEIVEILSNDPETDWSKVDIAALREHLVDMNSLTLSAEIKMETVDNAVLFYATAPDPKTLRALQNMVPAHAGELDKMPDWRAVGTATDNGATLRVMPSKDTDIEKVKALGFFGLMATGAHHQPHHLAMARGTNVHLH